MEPDLTLLRVLDAVAQAGNFRAAADRLGVTRSAVSQAIRRLEDSVGIALVQRSTRSVRLTEAGERLHRRIATPLAMIGQALDDVQGDGPPRGLLRVAVTSIAERFLAGPLVARFAEAYPGIALDVTVTDEEFDIVAAGFDAGVRLGEVIEQDMIAIPVGGPQREIAVASPAYLRRHGTPTHPRELASHRCIGWRRAPQVAPHRWEFSEAGRAFAVEVAPQVTTNDLQVMLRTALADGGITFAPEECFLPWLASGALVPVLPDYVQAFPGFFLYYPSRHNPPPKLRALVAHVRAFNDAS